MRAVEGHEREVLEAGVDGEVEVLGEGVEGEALAL